MNVRSSILTCGGSVLAGFVAGFFGGGGGMLCVPLTALIVILPICIVSAAIYIANGYFDFTAVLCASIGVSLGGAAGAAVLNKLNGTVVGLIFAALMIAIGIKLIVS